MIDRTRANPPIRRLSPFALLIAISGCAGAPAWFDHIPARAHVDVRIDGDVAGDMPADGVRLPFSLSLANIDRAVNSPAVISRSVLLRIRGESDDFVQLEFVGLRGEEDFDLPDLEEPGASVELRLARPCGTFHLRGHVDENGRTASGAIDLRLAASVKSSLTDTFRAAPSVLQSLLLVTSDVRPDHVLALRRVRPETGLTLATVMAGRGVPVEDVEAFVATGIDYTDDDILRLIHGGGTLRAVITWHEAGQTLSVPQVIFCHQRGLTPAYDRTWRDANYPLTIEQLDWARQRGLSPDRAREWREVGQSLSLAQLNWCKQRNITSADFAGWKQAGHTLTLDQISWARQRGIAPAAGAAWKKAGRQLTIEQLYFARQRGIGPTAHLAWQRSGYELDLNGLYWVKQRSLSPEAAQRFRKHGFTFSIADLYRLEQNSVTPDFAARFVDSAYRNPTVEELVGYRRRGITAEDAKKLRRDKGK